MSSFEEEKRRRVKSGPAGAAPSATPAAPTQAPVSRSRGPLDRPVTTGQVVTLQRAAGNLAVSRLLADEIEERGQDEERSPVHDVVGHGGQPLPESIRGEMESSFGQDFSAVRVHTDATAAASARSVEAKAYTVGDDVVLSDSVPSIGSREAQHTLAHELTHVVQQRSGPVDGSPAAGGISVSDPSDRFEHEADHVADRVMTSAPGSAGPASTEAASVGAAVQREPEENENESEDEGEGSAFPVQRQGEEEDEEDTEESS